MYPILFKINGLTFYSYGLFVSLAVIAGSLVIFRLARKKNLPTENFLEKTFGVVFIGLLFAHLSYFLFYLDQFSHWFEIFYLNQGLTSFGGVIGGLLGLGLFFRKKFFSWLDLFSLGFLIGVFFWRIGCFLTGDHPTLSQPSWMTIQGSVPVPLFESILGLIGAGLAYLVFKKRILPTGFLFWLTIGYYGLLRLIIDQWRLDPMVLGLRWGQVIGIGFVIIAIGGIIVLKIKKQRTKN